MNLRVSKSMPDGAFLVVKVFNFLGRVELMATVPEKLVEGDPCVLDYRPDTFNTVRTMQIIIEEMGGLINPLLALTVAQGSRGDRRWRGREEEGRS